MEGFITVERACGEFLISARMLDLHAQRGNLAWRTVGQERVYEVTSLSRLFGRRAVATAEVAPSGLGSARLGETQAGEVAHDVSPTPEVRRRLRATRRGHVLPEPTASLLRAQKA